MRGPLLRSSASLGTHADEWRRPRLSWSRPPVGGLLAAWSGDTGDGRPPHGPVGMIANVTHMLLARALCVLLCAASVSCGVSLESPALPSSDEMASAREAYETAFFRLEATADATDQALSAAYECAEVSCWDSSLQAADQAIRAGGRGVLGVQQSYGRAYARPRCAGRGVSLLPPLHHCEQRTRSSGEDVSASPAL